MTLVGQPRYYCLESDVFFKENSVDMINNDAYKRFQENLVYLKENPDRINRVYVSGSTSPDGNTGDNIVLCNKRTWKVIDIFLQYLPANKIYVLSNGEDYDLLYDLVEESDDPDKQLILNILSIHRNPKYHLKQYPAIWNRLSKQYFPLLRRVHVEVYIE
jgi:hypothetical protein